MITDEDREALKPLLALEPDVWLIAPPCFIPNDLCRDQESRGLIALKQDVVPGGIRWWLKLTAFGRIALK